MLLAAAWLLVAGGCGYVAVGGNDGLLAGRPVTVAIFANRTKKEVFLKADQDVPYGEVVKTMAEIKGAGIERLGMVTEPAGRR